MTELLPCSKCRRVPQRVSRLRYPGDPRGEKGYDCGSGRACHPVTWHAFDDTARKEWNIRCGSPLTLAERPQDVPACDEPSVGDGVRVVAPIGRPVGAMFIGQPTETLRKLMERPVSTPTCDETPAWCKPGAQPQYAEASCYGGKMRVWRECGDALARWSVMSCSGGG